MKQRARVSAGVAVLVALLVTSTPTEAQLLPPGCVGGPLPSGAQALICVPSGAAWNGQLVVYAPGYTPPQLPLGFYQLNAADGTSLPALVQSLGYAFATTTYRKNGLAVLQGADDIRELVAAFALAGRGAPSRTHLAGVSYGGLIAALLAERSPNLFASTLAACGPIGSFRQQVNYLGDFRALFDYYFPGVLPGSPVAMPAAAAALWASTYVPAIQNAFLANPAKALELMRVSRAAYDPANLMTVIESAVGILQYNVLGLNDAIATLGGNPYGNRGRWYFGSSNDLRLNLLVRRYDAAPAAVAAMGGYETTGDLSIPLVTIHTTADPIAPFAHELLYLPKVDRTARGLFLPVPVARYGHCRFTGTEIALAFLFTANLP
jgi:pimeloyl-ACP methyl ester carboxylesterase